MSVAPTAFAHLPHRHIQIDHPFIVNLRYAFQDDENCFFVLDLMLGGDLRCECIKAEQRFTPLMDLRLFLTNSVLVHLERLGRLSEESVQLYTAELSSALSYLHGKRIIHR